MSQGRDGSNNMVQQFIHGTQYIDELVMMRAADQGDLYVHQDANWNVIATTDLGGSVVERYVYTPYGEIKVHQETAYGDRDGDGDVDATDKGTPGSTCTGTVSGACRILDLDFDGDYDATDATTFDSLPQGLARHPGQIATATDQPFGHQGLLYEPEITSYQNRARQYDPAKRRFAQRDPLAFTDRMEWESHYSDGANTYAYLRCAPTRYLDPSGLLIYCGRVRCQCDCGWFGEKMLTYRLYADASGPPNWLCWTTPWAVYCRHSTCQQARNDRHALRHECTHWCDMYGTLPLFGYVIALIQLPADLSPANAGGWCNATLL